MGISDELFFANEHTGKLAGTSDELQILLDIGKPQGISDELALTVDYKTAPIVRGPQVLGASIQGKHVSLSSAVVRGFTGRIGAGAIVLSGALEGHRVFALVRFDGTTTDAASLFESTISFSGFIYQVNGADLSSNRFGVILLPT